MINKTIKIRLYPNQSQEEYLAKLFGCYRKVYNLALDRSINEYENNGNSICSLPAFTKLFHNEFTTNEDLFYLREHNTKILKDSLKNLSSAFGNFFSKKAGFPNFKSKYNKQSIGLYNEAFSKNVFNVKNKLFISKKFGYIPYRTSKENKEILSLFKPQRLNISKNKAGHYYCTILIEDFDKSYLNKKLLEKKPKNDFIGFDLGITDFIVTSDNTKYKNIKIKRINEKKLATLHRKLSKRVKGSNNRNKARIKLSKFYHRLNNIKENYLHSVSNELLYENQNICIENLDVESMMQNHRLARSIQELSLGRFKSILKYKSEWYDNGYINVDRYFPSTKQCFDCYYKHDGLTLNDRKWVCPNCGVLHDRDYTAALNILREGIKNFLIENPDYEFSENFLKKYGEIIEKLLPTRSGELTPLESIPLGTQ